MKNIKFFLDFDGTITQNDVVDMILERFADSEWKTIEKLWAEGKIGSRECLSRQMALVKASWSDVKTCLDKIELDPYFVPFMKQCEESSVSVTIVSDGFDKVIYSILDRALVEFPAIRKAAPIFANHLTWFGGNVPGVSFSKAKACEHGCANCKPEIIKNLKQSQDTVVFVGDGLSDRFAAKSANVVFAKNKLFQFCVEGGIACKKYSNFKTIQDWLKDNMLPSKEKYSIPTRSVST